MSLAQTRAFRRHAEEQFAITASLALEHDPSEVETFAAAMSRFDGMDFKQMRIAVGETPLPKGFVHVRIHNASDGEELGFALGRMDRPATARDLVDIADPHASGRDNIDAWIATTVMPVTTPGILELAIHYRLKADGWEAIKRAETVAHIHETVQQFREEERKKVC